jgi:putative transposase
VSAPHRKKLHRYEVLGGARFLTFSCFQRLPLFGNDAIKNLFVEHLERSRRQHRYRLIAWVIMPEHVHLILVPDLPTSPITVILQNLKADFARAVIARWKELDAPVLHRLRTSAGQVRFWQHGGGYDRNVRDEAEYFQKIDYIHGNPVKRGLVENSLDWPWSSARWYAGDRARSMLAMDVVI